MAVRTCTVTRANFDDAVLRASATRPVLVDFWAPWCAPCRALAPILDRLADEFAGRFTLAKLNTEDEPELAARYGVRGIPNCKLFVDGKVDVAVLWEPDVTEALKGRTRAHVLISTKDADKLIADVMVADEDFIHNHPDVIAAFVKGWLEGAEEANIDPLLGVQALQNEPKFAHLGEQTTHELLRKTRLTTLADKLDVSKYLTATSDIVALTTLAHCAPAQPTGAAWSSPTGRIRRRCR